MTEYGHNDYCPVCAGRCCAGAQYAAPSPAPAVGELVRDLNYLAYALHYYDPNVGVNDDVGATLSWGKAEQIAHDAIARIKQLEAGLATALPYVEAANRAEHLMDGFGPRSHQRSDEHVAAIRALLKGQS